MKSVAPALALLMLGGCGAGEGDPQSEEMIANAAAKLEKEADANVNRMIAEIEASAERPLEPPRAPEPEDKAGIEEQGDGDS